MKKIIALMALVMIVGGMECSAQTISGKVAGHEYVDLGLPSGLKWATYNVGATKPTEDGYHFAWGETTPKNNYSWETYKLRRKEPIQEDFGVPMDFTKYVLLVEDYYPKGTVADNKKELEGEDDAATANWGSAWRMPTLEELVELEEGCIWQLEKDFNGSGIAGQLGTSVVNGNKIFLPFSGIRDSSELEDDGRRGYYWSSTVEELMPYAFFYTFTTSEVLMNETHRSYGLTVRAVLKTEEGKSSNAVLATAIKDHEVTEKKESSIVNTTKDKSTQTQQGKTETTGEEFFTVSGKKGKHTYVDLGLKSGTKWATCNVGATKPTESGDYFAWGETTPKNDYNDYNWETYKWCEDKNLYYGDPSHITKYCTKSKYGIVDNKTVLEAEDDAATANWGKAWRMPTKEEHSELVESCIWNWVDNFKGSGVAGLVGTSKTNGNKIFLPSTDCIPSFYTIDYWSPSLRVKEPDSASLLQFDRIVTGNFKWELSYRYHGFPIRAVVK